MKMQSLLFASLLVQACVSNAIRPEDRLLLNSVQLVHSKAAPAGIDYRGKGSTLLSRVNIGVGVGTGVGRGVGFGAGVSKNLGREPSSELDAMALDNKIDIDEIMEKKFKARALDAGVVFVDSGAKLKFTAHSTKLLFEGVVGNPTLTGEADFILVEGNREVWKYTAHMQGSGKDFPSYSREELLIKENLQTVVTKASEILVDEAIKNLNEFTAAR